MDKVNWNVSQDIIDKKSAKFLHKLVINRKPDGLFKLIKFPRTRTNLNITSTRIAKTARTQSH